MIEPKLGILHRSQGWITKSMFLNACIVGIVTKNTIKSPKLMIFGGLSRT